MCVCVCGGGGGTCLGVADVVVLVGHEQQQLGVVEEGADLAQLAQGARGDDEGRGREMIMR